MHRLPFVGGRGVLLSALVPTLLAHALAAPQTADYDELTNTYRANANFNVETTRGMALATGGRLVTLNTHGSTLNVHLTDQSLVPDFEWSTLNKPIAVGLFDAPSTQVAVVLGGASHAIVVQDLDTGRILSSRELGAEPGDLVVDNENDRAFVSLPGNNTVVQLQLPDLTEQGSVTVPSQRPRFLFLDNLRDGDPTNNVVYVAPELSGNNSAGVLLNSRFQAVSLNGNPSQLPDEDLFRVVPGTTGPPTLEPALRSVGTLLMAHGRNPGTGAYWMLGVDALNAISINDLLDPTEAAYLSEPVLRGEFARNELTIVTAPLGTGSGTPPDAPPSVDLDGVDAMGDYVEAEAMSFPYALEFHPNGFAVAAASASDQLRFFRPNGARYGDLELPEGSIPRDLAFGPNNVLYVYCWGTNEIRVYDAVQLVLAMDPAPAVFPPSTGYLRSLELGADPLSERAQRGRAIFYDADNSAAGRVTCNHCHPGGGMDLIGWNIRDFPHDHKDLMVTQSLKSIEDTFPYHWRGERDLEAFNPAFDALLGGQQLDEAVGGEFEDFKAFVFSLQVHANPIQNVTRKLDASLSTAQSSTAGVNPVIGDPIQGQIDLDQPRTLFDTFSCADCHGKPTGSVGDINGDDVGFVPGNTNMDVAHFRQLFHKNHDVVTVTAGLISVDVPRGGFGISHDGDNSSTFDFVNRVGFDFSDDAGVQLASEANVAAFVEQADQGISPAAHRVIHVDAATDFAVLEADFIAQARVNSLRPGHWIDLAVLGTHRDSAGVDHDLTWFVVWFGGDLVFFSSDPTVVFPNGKVGYQSWPDLRAQAEAGNADFHLVGLPPGNSLTFTFDRDDDLLFDRDEPAAGTSPYDPDTDGDGDPDGHEYVYGGTQTDGMTQSNDTTDPELTYARIDHIGASYLKTVLRFSEPVLLEITGTNTAVSPPHVITEKRFVPRSFDSVTIQRLLPSIPAMDFSAGPSPYPFGPISGTPYAYSFDVKMTDLSGNSKTASFPAVPPTRDQLARVPIPFNYVPGNPVPPAQLGRIVTDLDWTLTTGTTFQAQVSTDIRFEDTEIYAAYSGSTAPNGNANPHENQIVVAQVLHWDDGTKTWSVLPENTAGQLSVVAVQPDTLFATVEFRPDGVDEFGNPLPTTPLDIAGPFLLSSLTDSNGDATFDFQLSQSLPGNDKVKLNIVAILEQDSRDFPPPPAVLPANEFWGPSVRSYQMPATECEKRGLVFPAEPNCQ